MYQKVTNFILNQEEIIFDDFSSEFDSEFESKNVFLKLSWPSEIQIVYVSK